MVGFRDAAHDRQAEAGPAVGRGAARAGAAPGQVEDVREVSFRDAAAAVEDREQGVPVLLASTCTRPPGGVCRMALASRLVAWMDRRSERRRGSRMMPMPARPTAPVQPAAIRTIWTWALMTS